MNRTAVVQQAIPSRSLSPSQGILQRTCACGNQTVAGEECKECSKKKSSLQRKLAIGASNDPLEREADRVANQVMALPTNSNIGNAPPSIQRFTGHSTGQSDTVPASVGRVLSSTGKSLEPALQHDMEQRFGHDFSQVRVYSGVAAEQSARDIGAHAYTVGNDIVFGANRFAPGTHEGQRLLAHEMTHVIQQSNGDGGIHTVQRKKDGDGLLAAQTSCHQSVSFGGLPNDLRESMEKNLGSSFTSVRIHTDGSSAEETALSGARAITRGEEISFAPGHFEPDTPSGRALIAHELTHVVQQRRGATGSLSSMEKLEQEAQAAESSILSAKPINEPVERARFGEHRADFEEVLAVIGAAASGGVIGAADYIVDNLAKGNALIQRVDQLRKLAIQRGKEIVFPASLVQSLEALYIQIKEAAPSWLPLPDIKFISKAQPAGPLIIVAGVAITVEALILLFAMLIVFLWLLGNVDPATRKGRQKAVEDVLDTVEEMLKPKPISKPKNETKPEPKPEPKPDKTVDPLPPDVDTDYPRRDKKGCLYESIGQQFGRYPCHAKYATSLSGVSREVRVTTPEGLSKDFDAIDHGGTLYEVKTGYGWLPFTSNEKIRQDVTIRFITQSFEQFLISSRCDKDLKWYFNDKNAADYFGAEAGDPDKLRAPLLPPVYYVPFKCSKDSDD